MNYEIPENLRMMADTVARFVKQDLEPISRQVEDEDRVPPEIIQKMAELGLFGLAIPEEYDGLGLPVLGECLVYEELSKTNACFRTLIGTNNGIGSYAVVKYGTEEQKKRILPKLASGEWISCFGLSEPEAGSDASNIKTTADWDGEKWVLNGKKHFITNGDLAHVSTVIAVTDKEKGARGGMTAFMIERDFPGFSSGPPETKMGMHGSHTTELIFDNCEAPMAAVIGGEEMIGQGFRAAMEVLDKGRLTMGSCALGIAQRCFELSLEHAKQRIQFGKPIGQFQAVQFMLAEMATQIYAARQMLHHAATLRDTTGKSVVKEASMVKYYCTEMAGKVADMAVQIHGGMGYMSEYPIERFYRDVRLMRIYEGTSEIQKIVIAKQLLAE